jgi:hypothetical protein
VSIPDGPPIDVSVPIRPRMPIYAGNPGVAIELARSIDRGDEVNVSRLELGAHTSRGATSTSRCSSPSMRTNEWRVRSSARSSAGVPRA